MLRGYVYFGLLAFVPLYETQERGRSATYGAVLLTLMLGAGAIATLGTGRVADRIGVNAVMLGATAVVPPATLLYLLDDGPLGVVGLTISGAGMIATFTASIVMSQAYMPSRPATAAGLSIGLSMGIGGVASVGIGAIADATGLETGAAVLRRRRRRRGRRLGDPAAGPSVRAHTGTPHRRAATRRAP